MSTERTTDVGMKYGPAGTQIAINRQARIARKNRENRGQTVRAHRANILKIEAALAALAGWTKDEKNRTRPRNVSTASINWGDVGTVAHIAEKLHEIISPDGESFISTRRRYPAFDNDGRRVMVSVPEKNKR